MSFRESRWFDRFCDWFELLFLLVVVAAMAIVARFGRLTRLMGTPTPW